MAKEHRVLTADQQTAVFNLSFSADTVQIINYTPFVLYFRIGDNLDAGPESYHIIVAPATVYVQPVSARNFSARIAIGSTSATTTTILTNRVDFFFTLGETMPIVSQMTLSVQNGETITSSLLAIGASESHVIDARGYENLGLNVACPAGQVCGVQVEVGGSTTGPWSALKNFRLDATAVAGILKTFLPNGFGWFRVTLWNDSFWNPFAAPVLLTYNLVHTPPPVESYRQEIGQTWYGQLLMQPSGTAMGLINFARFSGHLKKLKITAIGFFESNPLNAEYLLPFEVQFNITTDVWFTVSEVLTVPLPTWDIDNVHTRQTCEWEVPLNIYVGLNVTIAVIVRGPGGYLGNIDEVDAQIELGVER